MNCPNCGVPLLGGMRICPKCHYNLDLGQIDPEKLRIKQEREKAEKERTEREEEDRKRQEAIAEEAKRMRNTNSANFKATTGYGFDGYRIITYRGIRSGEVVLGTGVLSEFSASISDVFGTASSTMAAKLTDAKSSALRKLQNSCLDVGANAVIGVDIDIMTLGSNMIVACANGTAVTIEKI